MTLYRDPGEQPKRSRKPSLPSGKIGFLNLWDAPSVARPASEAAADAADRPAGRAKRLTDAMTILRCLVAYPEGLTRGELEQMTGLSGNTVRPRLCYDLYGLVEESEETREVAGHRAAHVVRATEQGRNAIRP